MARKPKVFCWSDGFHAFTVAAPSKKAALAAWGFDRDLFKDGSAREIDGGDDYQAALDRPGELIQRGLAVDVGESRVAKRKPAGKPAGPSKAALKKVADLEAEVAALEAERAEAEAGFERRRRAIEAEAAKAAAVAARRRATLAKRLRSARERL